MVRSSILVARNHTRRFLSASSQNNNKHEGQDQSIIAFGLFTVGLYLGAVMFGPKRSPSDSETLSNMKAQFRGEQKWDYYGKEEPRRWHCGINIIHDVYVTTWRSRDICVVKIKHDGCIDSLPRTTLFGVQVTYSNRICGMDSHTWCNECKIDENEINTILAGP